MRVVKAIGVKDVELCRACRELNVLYEDGAEEECKCRRDRRKPVSYEELKEWADKVLTWIEKSE